MTRSGRRREDSEPVRRAPRALPAAVFVLAAAMLSGVLLGLAPGPRLAWAQLPTQPGPDGTPQFDRTIERRTYLKAGPDALRTYAAVAFEEARALPLDASPEQVKRSPLRKRLLDLRLMLDFNAFLYAPERMALLRGPVDASYETVGQYKDLYDQARLTGEPIDPAEEAARGAAMNAALTWLRSAEERQAFLRLVDQAERRILALDREDQPRLWRVAGVAPRSDQSALATVALVSGNGLMNLLDGDLLVADILDPDQEEEFHDTRKALRSILVLMDMFPTAEDVVGDAREPLARVVDAFGEVNDAAIAYHQARAASRQVRERRDELVKAYKKARAIAKEAVESGQLHAYVTRLVPLQLFDVDPFH